VTTEQGELRPPAFFAPTDGGLEPHPDACGPWSDDMMHGRLLAGLAAWAVERDHGHDDFVPVRLTVDLYRSPAMATTTVDTRLVRGGGRVRAVDAFITVGGQDVARASTLWLKRTAGPEDEDQLPRSIAWNAPSPDACAAVSPSPDAFDVRPIDDRGFGAPGPEPRRVWLRDRRPLVAGSVLTPFVRAALSADFASPLANSGPDGIDYINADLTLHLGRLPGGEWIGIETGDRVATDGVSVAQCVYFDDDGPIGFSTVCAIVTQRMARR
jgi:hypothetical protein